MNQTSNVINLAEVRAARQAAQSVSSPISTAAPAAPALRWQISAKGNPWVLDARTRIHLVVYETRRGWSGRVTAPDGDSWYLDTMPSGLGSVEEAKAWAEEWLENTARIIAAAEYLDANPHAS